MISPIVPAAAVGTTLALGAVAGNYPAWRAYPARSFEELRVHARALGVTTAGTVSEATGGTRPLHDSVDRILKTGGPDGYRTMLSPAHHGPRARTQAFARTARIVC